MVEFGKRIVARSQNDEWKNYYLDYNYLKSLLPCGTSTSTTNQNASLPTASFDEEELVSDFRTELDREVEKVVLFLLQQQGEIARQLSSLSLSKVLFETDALSAEAEAKDGKPGRLAACLAEVEDLLARYRRVGEDLLRLVNFLEINVTAVRKVLKKHDKRSKTIKLSRRYLSTYSKGSDSHLLQLYHYGGLSALITSLHSSLIELRRLARSLEYQVVGSNYARSKTLSRVRSEPAQILPHFDADAAAAADLINDDDVKSVRTASRVRIDSVTSGASVAAEDILERIYVARRRLQQSTRYVEVVAAQALMFDDGLEIVDGLEERYIERTWREKISSFLNLASTCLYMTNYYIIAPTSGKYADKLGSSEALAGIVIGMTPNAALFATVLYGWWSNYSYKSALLFAAGCSILGNIFYATALHYDSITMVMIGRFLNGFGSARAINRRFIADTFSRSERTAASAAFVTAGALGMSLGPAIAAVLSTVPSVGNLWTVETSPGWVMFVLWGAFFVGAMVFFAEPDRSHLFTPVAKQKVELDGEQKQLLSASDTQSGSSLTPVVNDKSSPLYKNIPVMMTLLLYFVLKLVLECLLSSCATVTSFYFDWDSQNSGIFLAVLGSLMFPANMVVASCSHKYDDRQIILFSIVLMLVGIVGFISYDDNKYSIYQYIAFGVIIFLSTNALEGPNMGLLSKTIPRIWAKGTFNSGFLATEAGTLARSVGDVLISAVAGYLGFENLLNWTFMPLGLLVLVSLGFFRKYYSKMVYPDDE